MLGSTLNLEECLKVCKRKPETKNVPTSSIFLLIFHSDISIVLFTAIMRTLYKANDIVCDNDLRSK
jgi:hypothetical protein